MQGSVVTVVTDTGLGSAWVISSGGGRSTMVTNFHVVEDVFTNGRRSVRVKREDLTYDATIVETSPEHDLAVLDAHVELPALAVSTDVPAVGDPVLAVGSPLGLGGTVSSGIVSGIRKEAGRELLQFSAPISPGNSGGPVVGLHGKVVGVAVLKAVAPGAEGLSFAIPSAVMCSTLDVC